MHIVLLGSGHNQTKLDQADCTLWPGSLCKRTMRASVAPYWPTLAFPQQTFKTRSSKGKTLCKAYLCPDIVLAAPPQVLYPAPSPSLLSSALFSTFSPLSTVAMVCRWLLFPLKRQRVIYSVLLGGTIIPSSQWICHQCSVVIKCPYYSAVSQWPWHEIILAQGFCWPALRPLGTSNNEHRP